MELQVSKKVVTRDQQVVFTNWTEEDFEGTWDKQLYKFGAKKSYYLPFFLAEHFAKHLGNREINKTEAANRNVHVPINFSELQKMIDNCVEILPFEEKIGVVVPERIPVKEVVLKRDVRNQEVTERFGEVGAQINKKALKQAEESDEFEAPPVTN